MEIYSVQIGRSSKDTQLRSTINLWSELNP